MTMIINGYCSIFISILLLVLILIFLIIIITVILINIIELRSCSSGQAQGGTQ